DKGASGRKLSLHGEEFTQFPAVLRYFFDFLHYLPPLTLSPRFLPPSCCSGPLSLLFSLLLSLCFC
ncbi:unnamed protein product, partial [Amoebophrya sp. A120]